MKILSPVLAFCASSTNRQGLIHLGRVTKTAHNSRLWQSNLTHEDNSGQQYFLLKSEPSEFSIHDLEKSKFHLEEWDGVRNFEARNIMREMKVGDRAFFYHSSCKVPGIVGTVNITREAEPDKTAYEDPNHAGYDPKSTKEKCRWDAVQVQLETIYPTILTLKELKVLALTHESLSEMTVLKRKRLSVTRITAKEWEMVEELIDQKANGEDTTQR